MDEQTSTAPETPIITPDPVVADTPVVEPPQAEPAQAPAEPVAEAETAQTEPLSEPIPEPPTAHMGRNEPLLESIPEPEPHAEALAEAPEVETPIPEAEELPPPSTEQIPSPQPSPVGRGGDAGTGMPIQQPETQQGTTQPEPPRTPEPPASPMPAQAPVIVTPPPQNIVSLILTKARAIIQLRKQKKLVRIMNLFEKKKNITNDDVEKLLHVSDATATRYLSELEKQGKIIQTGKTGHAVTYTKR